jgi:hypothetical protein
MRSINRGTRSLLLSTRRADIVAFWVVSTAVVSLLITVAAWLLHSPQPWAWTVGGLCVLFPGLVRREWFVRGVAAWNKGVRLIAVSLRAYVLRVSYYVLFAAMARRGSSTDTAVDHADSRWVRRSESAAFGESGKWVVCLHPVTWLLGTLPDDHQDSAPLRSTYTLY